MPAIERSALVPYAAIHMYQLVNDVSRYPEFLAWCSSGEVLESGDRSLLARVGVTVGGASHSFTTRNAMDPGEAIHLQAVDGPFQYLEGQWRFRQLGEDGCKIVLALSFEFSSSLLSSAFAGGFALVAGRLVGDFCRRADALYG